jgi:hypothetical protein
MSVVNDSFFETTIFDQISVPGFTSIDSQLYPTNSSGMEIKLSEVNSSSSVATILASKNNSTWLNKATLTYHFVKIWKH